jgi:phosphate-selective porin OprO and OprP
VIAALLLADASLLAPATSGVSGFIPTPTFMSQIDYDSHATEPATFNGFELARLRLGLRANPVPWFSAVASFEYSHGSVTPFESYVEAVAARSWHRSVGFRRTPLFHTAKDELIEALPIPELSLPARALWPGVDLGAEVHYTPETVPVEAWLRFGNGSDSVQGNDGPNPTFDGRTDLVLGRARPDTQGFWGLRVGVGGHAKNRVDATGLTDTTPDGFLFYHAAPTNGWQVITEAHAALWLGRWTATLEAGAAAEQRVVTSTAGVTTQLAPLQTRGEAFELACMVWGPPRRPGQSGAPGVFPNETPFTFAGWRGGSVEVAARIERVDLEADAPDIRPGGAEGGAVSVDWWATPFTALSLAAYDYHFFLAPIEEPSETSFWLVTARATVSFR